jgi:hypothetical protein
MLSHVVWYKFTDVSDVLAASIIGASPDGGGNKYF